MLPHQVPEGSWQKVGRDIMTYQKQDYLIILDYFSKHVEVPHLRDLRVASVIITLKGIFARHGIQIVSNNMHSPAKSSEHSH